MDAELLVVELAGPMVTIPGTSRNTTRLLFVVSTMMSHEAGGALPRAVTLRLRHNVSVYPRLTEFLLCLLFYGVTEYTFGHIVL